MKRVSAGLRLTTLGYLLGASACARTAAPPPQNPQEQAAVDSLVHLQRNSLSDKDPHRAMQAIMCYIELVDDEFGELRGGELITTAEARAYTWRDHAAIRRRDEAIANQVFYAECVGHKDRVGNRARADSSYLEAHRAGSRP